MTTDTPARTDAPMLATISLQEYLALTAERDRLRAINADLLAALAALKKHWRGDCWMMVGYKEADEINAAFAISGAPRYDKTYCSQCGGEFGPGNHGFSHCEHHRAAIATVQP